MTLCLLGPPLSFNTPTGGLLGLLAVDGPASDAGVGVIVIVRDAVSAARGPWFRSDMLAWVACGSVGCFVGWYGRDGDREGLEAT